MAKQARIVGNVEYREGDGPSIVIRKGPIEVEETELDVTISWQDGETRGSTAMPLTDYQRYLSTRAIEVLDGAPA